MKGARLSAEKSKLTALPPGFFAVSRGGRPKKEARDAAIFLAKIHRMQDHNDSAAKAEEWIVQEWESAGTDASKGIGETAHVRAAIKRARKCGLDLSLLQRFEAPNSAVVWTAVEGDHAARVILQDGSRAWCWVQGMTAAVEARVRKVEVSERTRQET